MYRILLNALELNHDYLCVCPDLDEGDLARAHVALGVLDDHLPIVLQPALLTQYVVDAGHCLVPFVVIPVTDMTAVQQKTLHTTGLQCIQICT